MNKFLYLIAILSFLLLAACSGTAERKKMETLNDAIDEYAYALRWGRTNEAISYHIDEDGTKPEIDSSVMDSIRVTGFQIRERTLNPEQTEATVKGELNYHRENSPTVRTIEYNQRWWYEPDSGQWFLDSEFPDF